jgi:hypothetical protein
VKGSPPPVIPAQAGIQLLRKVRGRSIRQEHFAKRLGPGFREDDR